MNTQNIDQGPRPLIFDARSPFTREYPDHDARLDAMSRRIAALDRWAMGLRQVEWLETQGDAYRWASWQFSMHGTPEFAAEMAQIDRLVSEAERRIALLPLEWQLPNEWFEPAAKARPVERRPARALEVAA